MNYQLTCPCGNQFVVSDAQLGKHIPCPLCNRALLAVAPQPSGPSPLPTNPALHPEQQPVKQCPFCGETILAVARKCRYCNEFLDRSPAPPSPGLSSSSAASQTPATTSPAIFELSVSQWDNFFRYLVCTLIVIGVAYLLFFMPIPSLHAFLKPYAPLTFIIIVLLTALSTYLIYLGTRNTRCTIRPDRIETQSGIFSKQNDQVDLIRVIDLELRQNLLERILGVGTIMIKSSDPTSPTLELYQIPRARKVYKYLQDQIPNADRARGALRVES